MPSTSSPSDTAQQKTARRPAGVAVALTAGLIALLILVSAMPPLGTAAYLAGLPMAAVDLGVTTAAAQWTLTVYVLGMSLGQLFIGPLSDRLGRRRPLLIGIGAFVLLSASVAFAPTLGIMLVLRFFQGFAASSGMVLGRAIVHDMVQGDRAARVLNVITAAGLIVPALAPLLGSAVLVFADWRAIFLVLALLGALVGVWAFRKIPETAGPNGIKRAPGTRPRATPPNTLRFIMFTAVVALAFMGQYAYISSAPFVFQQLYGFTPGGYAWTGALLSLIMAAVGIAGSRLIGKPTRYGTLSAPRAVGLGLAIFVVGAVLVLAAVLNQAPVGFYIAALAVAVAPVALISGSATALAMDASPLQGGSSSAVIGFTQALLGAASPPLVGLLGVDARPMAILLLTAAVLAALASWIAHRAKQPGAEQ